MKRSKEVILTSNSNNVNKQNNLYSKVNAVGKYNQNNIQYSNHQNVHNPIINNDNYSFNFNSSTKKRTREDIENEALSKGAIKGG